MPTSAPTVCFVGPALGGHPGYITTQGEVLAGLFEDAGDAVLVTSTQRNKLVRAADSLACILRWRRSIDIAVVSVFSGQAFALADQQSRLTAALRLPTVLWLHGGGLPDLFDAHPDRARRVLRRAVRVVAPSDYLARAAGDLGIPVTVIPNVLDLDAYSFRPRASIEPRLLWMRTFHPLYRPDMAVDVLAQLRRAGADAHLTMAGHDAGDLDATRGLAVDRAVADHVTFPGFLGPAAKRRAFDEHDVFLNTNRVDNAPVSLLEAAASGLPIVATDVGGVSAVVEHGRTALLVADGDADGMGRAVRRLLDEPELVASLSAAGRQVAERSAWPAVRAAWRSLFDDVR
jgi:glycosyltransferase involved in cell wall biosynthesis